MADAGIKKATLLYGQLPFVRYDENNLFYDLRYRIISEDKNRASFWSPVKRVIVPSTTEADLPYTTEARIEVHSVNVDAGRKSITATWTFPQEESEFNLDPAKAELERRFSLTTQFDIFIRWSANNTGNSWADWKYETRISSNTYSLLRQETPFQAKRINIAVQLPTLEKQIDSRLQLFNAIHAV